MTDDRRYQDDEIRQIFEAAAAAPESGQTAPSAAEGFTLAELQEIGNEVGLAPDRIADAASALEVRRDIPPYRTFLGMPVAVSRTVDLPRAPTDREWEMLVAELRETFHARGKVESTTGSRHWVNGNLHAYVEPTEAGYRLRMGTVKGDARPMHMMGIVGVVVGLFMMMGVVLGGAQLDELVITSIIAVLGGGALVANRVRLPQWAWEREQQMTRIASRALELIGPGSEDPAEPSNPS